MSRLNDVLIVFGPDYEVQAQAIRMRLPRPGPSVVTSPWAERLQVPGKQAVNVQLVFAHYLPGSTGEMISDAQLQVWSQQFLASLPVPLHSTGDPKVEWFNTLVQGGITVAVFWEAIAVPNLLAIAQAMEQTYARLGGPRRVGKGGGGGGLAKAAVATLVLLLVLVGAALAVFKPWGGGGQAEGPGGEGVEATATAPEVPAAAAGETVVGAEEAPLTADAQGAKPAGKLPAGTVVTVGKGTAYAVEVTTADKKTGWVRRCYLCSGAEYEQRKATSRVPRRIVCMGFDKNLYLYGAFPELQEGDLVWAKGDALWMDPSMTRVKAPGGRDYTFPMPGRVGATTTPDQLFLVEDGATTVTLPLGALGGEPPPAVATGPGTKAPPRPGGPVRDLFVITLHPGVAEGRIWVELKADKNAPVLKREIYHGENGGPFFLYGGIYSYTCTYGQRADVIDARGAGQVTVAKNGTWPVHLETLPSRRVVVTIDVPK